MLFPNVRGMESDVHSTDMTRFLWFAGLSLALIVFGGWTVGILCVGISHRHLSSKAIVMLVANGYVAWITFQYLRQNLAKGTRVLASPLD
jgi:hypothetical protein